MTGKPTYEELERKVKELEKVADECMKKEKAFQASDQEKEAILNSLLEHVIHQDTELKILWANRAACESVNLTYEQLVGRYCYEVWSQRNDPCPDCPVMKAIKTGQHQEVEKTTPDGRCWFIRGYPLRDSNGKIKGGIEVTLEVTEQKQAEDALKESEEKYREFVEGTDDFIAQVDSEGKLTYVNDKAEKIFGLSAEKCIGLSAFDFIHPDDRERTKIAFDEWVRNRISNTTFENRQINQTTGEVYHMHWTINFHYNEDGNIININSIARDITERKQAIERIERLNLFKEKLLASGSLEEKLKWVTEGVVKIFEADFCRVWITKPGDLCELDCFHAEVIEGPHVCLFRDRCLHLIASSGTYTHVDGGHRRVPFGAYKIGRVASGEDADFITNNVVNDPRIHNHDWARENGLVSFAGYRLLSTRGDSIGVLALFSKKPISSDEHALLKGVANATAQVIQTAMAEEELRESEEFLNAIIENIPDMIFVKDAKELRFVRFNKAGEELLGYSREELIGKNACDFFPKEEADFFTEKDRDVLNSGELLSIPEEPIHTKYKGERILHTKKIPIFNEEGNPRYLLGISEDITESKRAEEEKKELEAQLHQAHKMESIGTLAGGIAHDFNNMLGIILGNTELAIYDVPEWNPARLNLEEIKTASLRAKDVVRQLLSFARKTDQKRKPVKINPIVKDVLKLLRSSIPTSIEIRSNIPKESQIVFADPTQINQVMINLCTNATQAMEEDGGILEISLYSMTLDESTAQPNELSPGQYVKLTVNDTGHGIAPKIKDRIFDPYFTTREVGKGSGMGLAVVHGIVMNHDGAITVESEVGKGTTFNIFFPIVRMEPVSEITIDEGLPAGKERILFVDDEESIVKMGSQGLERLGYQVESTTSPLNALDLFRSKPGQFDLVITDLTMPKMTGDRLVKEILSIRPDMRIIICTGFSEKMDGEKAAAIGASGYLEKPYEKRSLARMVRQVLDEKEG